MLRSLVTQLLGKSRTPAADLTPRVPPPAISFETGALVFVVNTDEPRRVMPGDQLYSELASLRLRTAPAALALAPSCPVYFLPPRLLAEPAVLDAMRSIQTLVVAKFSTGDLIKQPECFEALLEWLPEASDHIRLIADFSDNYAGYQEKFRTPFLSHYQRTLGEHCALTVACEALKQELLPYAKRGIDVIEDPFETPAAREPRMRLGEPLRLCWFGSLGSPNREMIVQGLVNAARGLGGRTAQLDFVTHEARADMVAQFGSELARLQPGLKMNFVPWSPEATWRAIDDCDLVLLPQDHRDPWGRVKSHNRLVETIRGGRLAIASPIPSYLELADFAWVGENLAEGVAWALSNPEVALARVRAGQRQVEMRFAPERIVAQWKRLLTAPARRTPGDAPAGTVERHAPGIKLNLGCGDKILPGYVNVDVAASRGGHPPDVLCDLRDLAAFMSDSAEEILAVHVVEHFWRWEVVAILREWVRVLRPGGKMILECPNLLSACEELLKNPLAGTGPGPEGQRTMWVFYGDPAWEDPLMCHRWNYTPQSLGAIMTEAGLANVRQEPAQFKLREPRDMRVVAEKPMR